MLPENYWRWQRFKLLYFQIQETAIDVIGDWGLPEDATALGELASDPFSVFVRPRICAALGKLGGEPSCEALVNILGMGDAECEHASQALAKCGPIAEDVLLRRGATTHGAHKRAICQALAGLGTEKSESFLTAATADADPSVASAASEALAKIGPR